MQRSAGACFVSGTTWLLCLYFLSCCDFKTFPGLSPPCLSLPTCSISLFQVLVAGGAPGRLLLFPHPPPASFIRTCSLACFFLDIAYFLGSAAFPDLSGGAPGLACWVCPGCGTQAEVVGSKTTSGPSGPRRGALQAGCTMPSLSCL